jgi:hypothetical protein
LYNEKLSELGLARKKLEDRVLQAERDVKKAKQEARRKAKAAKKAASGG